LPAVPASMVTLAVGQQLGNMEGIWFIKLLLLLLLLLLQTFYGSFDFVQDNPGEPVPEETMH